MGTIELPLSAAAFASRARMSLACLRNFSRLIGGGQPSSQPAGRLAARTGVCVCESIRGSENDRKPSRTLQEWQTLRRPIESIHHFAALVTFFARARARNAPLFSRSLFRLLLQFHSSFRDAHSFLILALISELLHPSAAAAAAAAPKRTKIALSSRGESIEQVTPMAPVVSALALLSSRRRPSSTGTSKSA